MNFSLQKFSQPLQEFASGDHIDLVFFRAPGDGSGPNTYLQAGLHGAEVQGNLVIFELFRRLPEFQIHGDISFVPHANPYAMNQRAGEFTQGRFSPTTGDNWNRLFWRATCASESERLDEFQISLDSFLNSQAGKAWADVANSFRSLLNERILARKNQGQGQGGRLALTLQAEAAKADIVLDLHCASVSLPHIYSPVSCLESAKNLLFPFYLAIPEVFAGAMDEASFLPWFELCQAAKGLGFADAKLRQESFTIELGNHETVSTFKAVDSAERILHYLCRRGVISEKISASGQSRFQKLSRPKQVASKLADYHQVFIESGGLWESLAPLGIELKGGSPLYRILRIREIQNEMSLEKASREVVFPVDAIPLVQGSSSIAHSGDEIFRVLTNYFYL